MKIYVPRSFENTELCHPVDPKDFDRIDNAERPTWSAVRMELIRQDNGKRLKWADAPWLGDHALVLRESAREAMGKMLCGGDLLELDCADAHVVLYVPRLVNALDHEKCIIERFRSGNVKDITRYAFRAGPVGDCDAFRLPEFRVSPIS
jgi:hypothetical protein